MSEGKPFQGVGLSGMGSGWNILKTSLLDQETGGYFMQNKAHIEIFNQSEPAMCFLLF